MATVPWMSCCQSSRSQARSQNKTKPGRNQMKKHKQKGKVWQYGVRPQATGANKHTTNSWEALGQVRQHSRSPHLHLHLPDSPLLQRNSKYRREGLGVVVPFAAPPLHCKFSRTPKNKQHRKHTERERDWLGEVSRRAWTMAYTWKHWDDGLSGLAGFFGGSWGSLLFVVDAWLSFLALYSLVTAGPLMCLHHNLWEGERNTHTHTQNKRNTKGPV